MLKIITRILLLAGIVLSSYLTYLTYTSTSCPLSGGCDLVITSEYSKILGIPVALLGVLGFALMFLLFEMNKRSLIFFLGIIGIAFIIYLQYLQIEVIKQVCTYCTSSHVLYVSSFLLAYYTLKRS